MKWLPLLLLLSIPCFGQFTNNGAYTTQGTFSETSFNATVPPVVVQTTSVLGGTQNVAYTSVQFSATGGVPCTGGSGPYTWTKTGSLPSGMTFPTTGILGGTPTLAGTSNITVFATDCASHVSAGQAISIVIASPPSSDLSVENLYTAAGDVASFTQENTSVTPPATGVFTALSGSPSGGSTCNATDAASFNACLASTSCGDIISVALGTYTGTFNLPNKVCDATHWVTIETASIGNANFPAEHVRSTPCQLNQSSVTFYPNYACPTPATLMPKFQTSSANQKAFTVTAGANHYRLIGLEVTKPSGVVNDNPLLDFSNGADHIILDRLVVHGSPLNCTLTGTSYSCSKDDQKQGIQFNNCTYCAIINSQVFDILCYGGAGTVSCDSQAVAWGTGGSTTGPLKIYNNLLASAAECFLSGGGGGTGGIDVEVRNNHCFHPVSWFQRAGASGDHPIVKNLGEFKNQDRALVQGNTFENSIECWCADQQGFGFLLTPKNQSIIKGGNATSDGAGHLTSTGNSFGNVVDVNCGTASHCFVKYNNSTWYAQTQTDATHILVNSLPGGGGTVPPLITTASTFVACQAGAAPNAHASDIDFRHNRIRNVTNGIQLLSVNSDCGDASLGYGRVNISDNLAEGINHKLTNGASAQSWSVFIEENNGFPTANAGHDVTVAHNTALVVEASAGIDSGLGYWIDGTNQTNPNTAGGCQYGPGAYFANMAVRDNISPAGWTPAWKSGGSLSGGAKCGINQQFCPNNFDDGTCTFTFVKNVLGTGLWTGQGANSPYPLTNTDPSGGGPGCNAAGQTCFPNAATFAAMFVNYNGGFNGDYHLVANSPYAGAGTDAKDLGYQPDLNSNYRCGPTCSNPTWNATTLTPAVITEGNDLPGCPSLCPLPSGAAGVAYGPYQLNASSASDMQVWQGPGQCAAGSTGACLPHGLSITRAGILSGTPDTIGSYTVILTMMDGAQQTATKTLSITIVASSAPVDLMTWISATNPTRTTNHQTGSSNPAYSWMDADGVKWWDLKAGTGHPWDVRTFGVDGGSNAGVCADYAPGKASICNWLTDFGSGGNFTNASAYKKQNVPFPTIPRTYTIGTIVTIDTPGPNSSVSTTNCEGAGTTNGNLGPTHTVSAYYAGLAWGSSVGTQPTYVESYYYTRNGTGPYGTVYNDRERFFHVQPYGRVTWDHASWDAPSESYIVDSTNTLTTQTAGGAPTPSFPCFGAGVTNWIGGTPGTGGNATTP